MVGIVALGVFLWKGLFKYYSIYCNSTDNVKVLVNSLDRLLGPLDTLSNMIKDDAFNNAARAYIKCYIANTQQCCIQFGAQARQSVKRINVATAATVLVIARR